MTNRRRLIIAIAIVATVLVLEVVGSIVSGSLSLLADAGHMLSDLTGLVVALIALAVSARPATDRMTWGRRRAEVFAAFINGAILLTIAVTVTVEAVSRLFSGDQGDVAAVPMLLVAAVGTIANVVALLVLRGGAKDSINMRGAYLEVLADLFGSIAVIVAAVVILTTGFAAADAIASITIAAMIVPRGISLLREVVNVLSESTPRGMDVELIRQHVLGTPGVQDVHDVHVWSITPGVNVFSGHVVVDAELLAANGAGRLLDELGECLTGHFDVGHSTFQLEPAEHAAHHAREHH